MDCGKIKDTYRQICKDSVAKKEHTEMTDEDRAIQCVKIIKSYAKCKHK